MMDHSFGGKEGGSAGEAGMSAKGANIHQSFYLNVVSIRRGQCKLSFNDACCFFSVVSII